MLFAFLAYGMALGLVVQGTSYDLIVYEMVIADVKSSSKLGV